MSFTQKIAWNTAVQFGAKLGGLALGLVTIGFLTRYLGVEGYGEYTTIVAFVGFFSTLADLGLYLIATREISKPGADQSKVFSHIFSLRLAAAAVVLALAPLIALWLDYSNLVKIGIALGVFAFFFVSANQVMVGVFQKNLRTDKIAVGELIGRVVFLGLVVALIHFSAGLLAIVLALVAANGLNFAVTLAFARKYIKIKLGYDKEYWRYILKETLPLAMAVVLNLLYFKFDTIMLSLMKPAEDVGIYGAAYKILEILIVFPAIFMGLVLPLLTRFWKEDKERFKKVFRKAFDFLAIAAMPVGVAAIFLAGPIITFIAGAEFNQSILVLQILAVAMVIIFFNGLPAHAIVAIGQQKRIVKFYAIVAVIGIVGNLILIPAYTYYGAAAATIATEALTLVFTMGIVYKYNGHIGPRFKATGKALIAAAAMGAFLYFWPPLQNNALSLFVALILGVLIYAGVLWLIRGFPTGTIREILSLSRKDE